MRASFFLQLYLDVIWYVNADNLDCFAGGCKWEPVRSSLCCTPGLPLDMSWLVCDRWPSLIQTETRLAVFQFKQFVKGLCDRAKGIESRGRWEGGSGWGIHVTPWLIHVNVWQNPLQYCKVISLQLIKINGKKKDYVIFFLITTVGFHFLMMFYNPILDTVVLEEISKCLPYLIFSYKISSVLLLSLSLILVNPTGKEKKCIYMCMYIYREREKREREKREKIEGEKVHL